jgi:thiol-disulfide isomerase/thioredoxin
LNQGTRFSDQGIEKMRAGGVRLFCCTVLLSLTVAGCADKPATPRGAPKTGDASKGEPKKSADAPKQTPAPAATANVPLTIVDPAGLAAEVAKHSGKLVLVDFWSTTCIPCIAGLPKMADLSRKYGDKGFVVITLGMDDKQDDETDEQFRSRLLSALGKSASEFSNLISKPGGGEEAMLAFEVDGGALPHYRLIGRDGKLIQKFVSGDADHLWDHTDVIAAVEIAIGK